VKASSSAVILKADRSLFGRIIVMAENRNLQMAQILAHTLGPFTTIAMVSRDTGWPIAQTNKATLAASSSSLQHVQKDVYACETPSQPWPHAYGYCD
jgi:hypothetical protein